MYKWAIPSVLVARVAFPGLIGTIRTCSSVSRVDPSTSRAPRTTRRFPPGQAASVVRPGLPDVPPQEVLLPRQPVPDVAHRDRHHRVAGVRRRGATGITLANQARWALTDEQRLLGRRSSLSSPGSPPGSPPSTSSASRSPPAPSSCSSACARLAVLRVEAAASGKERPAKPRKVTTLPPQLPRRSRRHAPIG